MLSEFISQNRLSKDFIDTAETYYVPLAQRISAHQKSARTPLFVGINGCQGSGKSTLSAFIQMYLAQQCQQTTVVISLDDFYLSHSQRQNLALDVHPLLRTRGVPGTHNMGQAKQVLIALKNQQAVTIPRFNKASDNPHHPDLWTQIDKPAEVIIFEGWCWGVQPQSSTQLIQPINELEATEDPKQVWRHYVNAQLAKHYCPLYSFINHWVMLKPPSFADVFAWRLEQEQKLRDITPVDKQQQLMNAAQIQRFIQHFQRLTEHGFNTLSNKCDEVFNLNSNRQVVSTEGKF